MSSPADSYRGFKGLANAQVEGTDYRIQVRPNAGSSIAVIAPHGASIEQYTSDVVRAVAGTDFNLYMFEELRHAGSYAALHLTSSGERGEGNARAVSSRWRTSCGV